MKLLSPIVQQIWWRWNLFILIKTCFQIKNSPFGCLKKYQQHHPSKYFNVVSTLMLSWYDVVTSDNVESTMKKRCLINVEIYNIEKRGINFVYLNVGINNVRQPPNNIVIFNVEFHNVDQRWNNAVNMTRCTNLENKTRFKCNKIFLSFK